MSCHSEIFDLSMLAKKNMYVTVLARVWVFLPCMYVCTIQHNVTAWRIEGRGRKGEGWDGAKKREQMNGMK